MAAQLYSETQIAECLYEVLSEMVADETIQEPLAVATLNQVRRWRAPTARARCCRPVSYALAAHTSQPAPHSLYMHACRHASPHPWL